MVDTEKPAAALSSHRNPFDMNLEPHILQIRSFIRSILHPEEKQQLVTSADAAGTMALMFALYESAASGKPVTV